MTLLINSNSATASAPKDLVQVATELKASAQKIADTYRKLVNERQANGSGSDEGMFLDQVQNLSIQTATIERQLYQLESSTDLKIKALSREIRDLLNGKSSSTQTSKMAPQNTVPKAEPKNSKCQERMNAASKAMQQFENWLELGYENPEIQEDLALDMFNKFKLVKENDDPSFRKGLDGKGFPKLLKKHDSLLQRAFAPKIPETVLDEFVTALCDFEVSKNTDLVQKYIDTQIQENRLQETMHSVNNGSLLPNNLRFKHPTFGEIDTDLSIVLEQFNANKALEKQYDALLPHIDSQFEPQKVPPDGNCFFHSVAHLIGKHHLDARQAITDQMEQNKERYSSFITERMNNDPVIRNLVGYDTDKYIALMKKRRTWGGKPELQALSDLLHRPILVRQTGSKQAVVSFFPTDGQLQNKTPLMFLNSGEGHFEPLVQSSI